MSHPEKEQQGTRERMVTVLGERAATGMAGEGGEALAPLQVDVPASIDGLLWPSGCPARVAAQARARRQRDVARRRLVAYLAWDR
jgi:hypothetical protein